MFSPELMYASGRQHQRDKFNIISIVNTFTYVNVERIVSSRYKLECGAFYGITENFFFIKKKFEKIEQPSCLETNGNHVIHIEHQMSQCGVAN